MEQLDWVSTAFPDFLAKANAAVCGDLQNTLDQLHGHVQSITAITEAWSRIDGLDMFHSETGPQDLAQLQEAHTYVRESNQGSHFEKQMRYLLSPWRWQLLM